MKKKSKYTTNKKYILTFVGDGIVKSFSSNFIEQRSDLYGKFDCGVELRIDNEPDTIYQSFFNVTEDSMNDYINCELFVFSSEKSMKKMLPNILQTSLDSMKEKSKSLLAEYMKLADDCTATESAIAKVKEGNFEIIEPSK